MQQRPRIPAIPVGAVAHTPTPRVFEESLQDINIAIQIHPNLAYGYQVRGQIYDTMGELEKAVADLDVAVQSSAAQPYTQRLRNELRRKLERRNSRER